MSTYRAVQVTGQRQFELVERELVAPLPGHVRFRAECCGVCHTDALTVEGLCADPGRPVVLGHEVVGIINAVGEDVTGWSVGDRVGVGFWAVTAVSVPRAVTATSSTARTSLRRA
jgi:propanol-preferring alcohol dehydrogenase